MGRSKNEAPRRLRFASPDEAGDDVECSGASCRSCAAVMVADCVALGCCPCAVVDIVALALVKVPWAVSRRCLGMLKRREGASRRRRVRDEGGVERMRREVVVEGREAKSLEKMKRWADVGAREGENGHGGQRSDADKVWMELYQIGHWGFGCPSREFRGGAIREDTQVEVPEMPLPNSRLDRRTECTDSCLIPPEVVLYM